MSVRLGIREPGVPGLAVWAGYARTGLAGAFVAVAAVTPFTVSAADSPRAPAAQDPVFALAAEVHEKGWICFGARASEGDWDLFVFRPDGSDLRSVTRTSTYNEFAPQFSRDGRQLLYRRVPRTENIDGNRYGEQGELVIAASDGREPKSIGKAGDFPWATWSPDASQIACLSIKGISLIDVGTRKVVRTLERKGIYQQLTWSADGQWLVGVANSFGTGWSIARLNLASGVASAINRVDCCTPDWFPDAQNVVFSWRPPGQTENQGQGWTQLWRADVEGKTRQLVYGEDGRHVYGGHVSPDGQYALFTGNIEEDGDPHHAGGPMGLMRLSDGPIIGGVSKELRSKHPEAKSGPVLALPAGWEPCWTLADLGGPAIAQAEGAAQDKPNRLAAELKGKGWLAFSARSAAGDWDLFLMRPDGTSRKPLTRTAEFNEAGVRFSPDGTRLLYYRMPKSEPLDNNTYGTFDLVLASADGSSPIVFGNQFTWASWGPDSQQIAALGPKGIQIVDVTTRLVVRQIPRHGIIQQLGWSPDGKRFVGTANGLGPFWNIGVLDLESGRVTAASETERYNCTPDWCPDSQHVVYARGIIPQQPGRAELWEARADGTEKECLYLEPGRHIYGACASPDGNYFIFTRSLEDLGTVPEIEMAIIRRPRPSEPRESGAIERLDLGPGWEPHWTAANVGKDQERR